MRGSGTVLTLPSHRRGHPETREVSTGLHALLAPGVPTLYQPKLSEEKPGICPLAEEAPLAVTPCGTTCTKDWQCPGAEKCCSSSRCGHVCSAPEPGEEIVARTVIPPGMLSKLLGAGCGTALPRG
uniref:Uncharacterized protein n=1 Tax=Corvus moneduloides TaxID=1196302 RepID=A0A8U7ND00_CORMO